jgi:signal transduction histidine kinase
MKRQLTIFVICLCCCILPKLAIAQDNPPSMNDGLHEYYLECRKMNNDPVSLKMADTLFDRASKLHDTKSQCAAYYVKALYYFQLNDMNNMERVKKELGAFSRNTPYHQYYFGLWSILIANYSNNGVYMWALKELKSFQKEATVLNDEFALGQSYIKFGDTYQMMNNPQMAIDQYNKGLDYYESVHDSRNLSSIYSKIGHCYMDSNSAMAEKYLLKSLETAKIEPLKGRIYVNLLDFYTQMNRKEECKKYFAILEEWEKTDHLSKDQQTTKAKALMRYKMMNGEYDSVLSTIDTEPLNSEDKLLLKSKIYEVKKDYRNALKCTEDYRDSMQRRLNRTQMERFAKYENQYENDKLKIKRDELALNNASLSIQELEAKRKLMTIEKDKEELNIKNTNLEIKNRNLKLISQHSHTARQKEEINRQKTESARLAEEIKNNKQKDIFIIITFAAVIIGAAMFTIQRKRTGMRLKREKEKETIAKKEAESAKEQALKANRLKSLFLQNMSHEIRTPLNAIVGFSDIVADKDSGLSQAEKDEYLALVHSNSKLLTTIINDILDLSNLESGIFKVNLEDVDINEVCKAVIASVNGRQASDVALKLDIPVHKFILHTDEQRLTQLLTNLMTNACKYTDKGSITLSYHLDGNNVIFSVTDTGCGISPENSEKIFNRFEKLGSGKQGTGLGLHICKQIANILHGDIRLDNTYTSGAKFVFTHPIRINENMTA